MDDRRASLADAAPSSDLQPASPSELHREMVTLGRLVQPSQAERLEPRHGSSRCRSATQRRRVPRPRFQQNLGTRTIVQFPSFTGFGNGLNETRMGKPEKEVTSVHRAGAGACPQCARGANLVLQHGRRDDDGKRSLGGGADGAVGHRQPCGRDLGEDAIRLARRMARIRRPADDAFKAIDTADEKASWANWNSKRKGKSNGQIDTRSHTHGMRRGASR